MESTGMNTPPAGAPAEPPSQLGRTRSSSQTRLFVQADQPFRGGSHDPESSDAEKTEFDLDVESTLKQLLEREDTDGSYQITVEDQGPKVISLPTANSDGHIQYEIRGTYMLSNLLQELTLAQEQGLSKVTLELGRLNENPVTRLSRRIAQDFWPGLTRRIDASSIEKAALDPKDWTDNPRPRIYVPHGESRQYEFYQKVARDRPQINLDVAMLPRDITPELLRDLADKPGLLAIAMEDIQDPDTGEPTLRGVPFVVPGGRFNEFYGWDSYFESLGLLASDRVDLARGMVDNFCFCIEHYGKILNATRSYFLCRSQPPFLTDLVLRVYDQIQHEEGGKEWLRRSLLAAIKEYSSIWTVEPRLDPKTGLSRYRPEGLGVPLETEHGHFAAVLEPYCKKHGMSYDELVDAYTWGRLKDEELDEYFMHDRAIRESGHDTSYRLENRCANMATIDLNCLLYKYETDIANTIRTHFDDKLAIPAEFCAGNLTPDEQQTSALWDARAEKRKAAIHKYCWSPSKGMFFDYDTAKEEISTYESATTFWALWAGVATPEQAAELVAGGLPRFEAVGGLTSTTLESRGELGPGRPQRQWDYPFGWAPQQMMAWAGLERYGFGEDAARVAYRWLYMMTRAFVDYNGVVVEKYDVTKEVAAHRVDAEYGNQGLGFKGVAKEGFGWVNASYVVGLTYLDPYMRRALEALTPWETYKKAAKDKTASQPPPK